MSAATDRRRELHHAGVHVECKTSSNPKGTPASCQYAGAVERIHSHDYDGPLICGCDDLVPVGVPS